MGKSKTVDMAAEKRILLPMCLREALGEGDFGANDLFASRGRGCLFTGSAYPDTDVELRDHLLNVPSADEEECKRYLSVRFLCSLFGVAAETTRAIFSGKTQLSYKEIAHGFHEFFANTNNRDSFYNAVVRGSSTLQHQGAGQTWIYFKEALQSRCSDWPEASVCPVLISFDEVHVLFESRAHDKSEHTIYSHLKSVISSLVDDFCVIVMSTASSVSKVAPSRLIAPSLIAPSLRERASDIKLPVPFTELPFDAHILGHRSPYSRRAFFSTSLPLFTSLAYWKES